MKIAILTNMAPFISGGAEVLTRDLKNKLIEYGHDAQIIRFYFSYSKNEHLLDGIIASKLTRIENTDCVIATKFPAYLIEHQNKKVWLIHQFRQAYDLENTAFDCFSHSEIDQRIKASIRKADIAALSKVNPIYTISPVITCRLSHYCGIDSSPLFPPLLDDTKYYFQEVGDFVFLPSRVNDSKRQALLVEAMRYTKTAVKLLLSGRGDTRQDEENIFQLIEKYDLSHKVTYLNRFISDKEKYELFSRCLMVAFAPLDEDYGYVTLEAFASKKPVLTCKDSGCPPYFISQKENGYIVAPDPKEIAGYFDYAYSQKHCIDQMGKNAYQSYLDKDITWDRVIRRLTE